MSITKELFGYTKDRKEIHRWTIENQRGNKISVLDYGCILQAVVVKDRYGKDIDVVLGFNSVEEYEQAGGFIGAVAGRVANRITGGCFELGGTCYELYKNDGNNHLHGGKEGFSRKIWDCMAKGQELCLKYISCDGEEGYPGTLLTLVRYIWTDDDTLTMECSYLSNRDTVVNLTNHSYFNLNGEGCENAMDQELAVSADFYTHVGTDGLVTGEIYKTGGTCFDFHSTRPLRNQCLESDPQIHATSGFDHNLILKGRNQIHLRGLESGVEMTMDTDSPGVQLYSGNYLRECTGKSGKRYGRRSGICLEPQFFPNSVNFTHFPTPFVEKNKWYTVKTKYHFYTSELWEQNNKEGKSNE